MVDQSVDSGGGCHRIFEDRLPLGERQVAADQHAAPLVTFGQKGEQHLHFFAALLHVAEIVDDQPFEARQFLDRTAELEVALGDQQILHQQIARGEVDSAAFADQFLTERDQKMRLAAAWRDRNIMPMNPRL